MSLRLSLILTIAVLSSSMANAQTATTEFDTTDGFVTGGGGPVSISADDGSFTATFTGGIQQQGFDGPSYSNGPAALLFINGTFQGTTTNTQTGTTNVGNVTFSTGVDTVSFFAADRANGTPNFSVFDVSGGLLQGPTPITSTVNNVGDTSLINLSSDILGGQIGQIEFNNAAPAGNPPYVIAIDGFSASVSTAVPEPTSAGLLGLVSLGMLAVRRRKATA